MTIAPPRARICNRCKADLREPARYCGMCEAEDLEATIRALLAPAPAGTLAVWKLRDRGLTGPQVLAIRREVRKGRPAYEVVKAIEGLANWRGGA